MITYKGIEGLANIYFNGDLVPEDMNRAEKSCWRKPLNWVREVQLIVLGWMYGRGFLSEQPDYVKALEYYEKAASLVQCRRILSDGATWLMDTAV